MSEKLYAVIDLKCFFASVECVERGYDPFAVNLVVADATRGNGAICLAISPAMKELGCKNRCRLYEIPSHVKYEIAKPRMKKYMEYSRNIFSIYLEYISPEDIYVYSIDECFLDLTAYVRLYKMEPLALAKFLMDEVYKRTGICATAGAGTNMFLAKVALDVLAKHVPDHIAYLDELSFRKTMWQHRPITDIWNIGRGTARRLAKYGVYDLFGITRMEETKLYKEFGVNAKFLIEHAWGREACSIKDVKNYIPQSKSLSNSQVLFEDYNYENTLIILKEMVDNLTLSLVEKGLTAAGIGLSISYSKNIVPATGGARNLGYPTDSYRTLLTEFINLFEETTYRDKPIRRIGICFNEVDSKLYGVDNIFNDYEASAEEYSLQQAIVGVKKRFGKNAVMKGFSYLDKATGLMRNKLIGGHNGE
ncbi:MAG: hypothetical protein Q4D21_08210 [Phascolarctobacterium sp.]|nr:hypothetical protein [Phascolarctobacterium sp.]